MKAFTKKDIGIEIHYVAWDRTCRNKEQNPIKGLITKIGPKNIAINGTEYRKIEALDYCLIASTGSVTDHFIKIYRCLEDIELQNEANALRKSLRELPIEELPLEKVKKILELVNS